jgi:hypothetical protein
MSLPSGRVTNDPTNYFAIGLQSAKDVDATTFCFLKHLDGSGFDVKVDASSERVGGSGREIGLRYRSKVTADGSYVAYGQADFLGRVIYAALGGVDTVTAGASNASLVLFKHQISSGATQLPYQTVEQNWADSTERTGNCLVADLKIEGEAGKPIKVTAQFVSGGTPHDLQTPLNPTRDSSELMMVPGGSVAITATAGLIAGAIGASSLQLTKWSLDIKNQLDDGIQTVALNREDVLWLNADYDIDGTFKYINEQFYLDVQYGGGSQVPTGTLTSGAFNFFTQGPSGTNISLLAPFVEFTNLKVNRLDPDGKTMYIDFTASTRNIGSQAIIANLTSTASGPYNSPTT